MKVISALGGGGSSFVIEALQRENYKHAFLGLDPYRLKNRIMKYNTSSINLFNFLTNMLGVYHPQLKVMIRPDVFWSDLRFNKTGVHNPSNEHYRQDLREQKAFIVKTYLSRSAGIKISESDIKDYTLSLLVKSYLKKLEAVERKTKLTFVLLSCHWGAFGIFKDLGIETIYIIRDPFNSIISFSKSIRHKEVFLKRGFDNINTQEWIDSYLVGPVHYWINHAQIALSHYKAIIVRYNHFTEDWKNVKGLPDISPGFIYKKNDVAKILTKESINFIYEKTKNICDELDLNISEYL